MVEIKPTRGIQLELSISQSDSCPTFTHESSRVDSCVNPQLSDHQHERILSFLTRKDTKEKRYGSGWLSTSKPGGTARTDNKYLVYYYRVHWRKRPFAVHIGKTSDNKVLEIGQQVRRAIDTNEQPYKIVNLIKAAKTQQN